MGYRTGHHMKNRNNDQDWWSYRTRINMIVGIKCVFTHFDILAPCLYIVMISCKYQRGFHITLFLIINRYMVHGNTWYTTASQLLVWSESCTHRGIYWCCCAQQTRFVSRVHLLVACAKQSFIPWYTYQLPLTVCIKPQGIDTENVW